jgi:hypothetical protein
VFLATPQREEHKSYTARPRETSPDHRSPSQNLFPPYVNNLGATKLAYVPAHGADLLRIVSCVVPAACIGAKLTEDETGDAVIGKIHAALSFLALDSAKKPRGSGWGCSMLSTSRWSSTRSLGFMW